MLPDIELPFQPSATNCLSWSEDGELAVAAADHVHILVRLDFCEDAEMMIDLRLTCEP